MKVKKLSHIFPQNTSATVVGPRDQAVRSICTDTRKLRAGACFVCVSSPTTDAHQFIEQAIAGGARTIVCERLPPHIHPDVTYIQIADTLNFCAKLCVAFFDYAVERLNIIGITGTNGKTTTATILYQLFSALGHKCALFSTVENRIGQEVQPATLTTPALVDLHHLLHQAHRKGCTHVFMECSSHAIVQNRIAGVPFRLCVFTNLSHDHLDYHQTYQNYIAAKKMLFDRLSDQAIALSNLDDNKAAYLLQNTKARKVFYALQRPADFEAKVLENHWEGLLIEIGKEQIHTRLSGRLNAHNLLAAYASGVVLGEDPQQVREALSACSGAKGRFEVQSHKHPVPFLSVIDYAHTPDALEKTLQTIGELTTKEHIICVFGCGGNRDKTKRAPMLAVACTYSGRVIVTSDNPRSEPLQAIFADMRQGNPTRGVEWIADRKRAIEWAIATATKGDVVLIAGKGHETYQEIHGKKLPFSDEAVVADCVHSFALQN